MDEIFTINLNEVLSKSQFNEENYFHITVQIADVFDFFPIDCLNFAAALVIIPRFLMSRFSSVSNS